MDREGNTRAALDGALRDVRRVNRWLGGRRALRLALRPLLLDAPADRPFRVLDVGTGAADLPQAMVELGRRHGRRVEVTAVDLDPTTVQIAASRTRDEPAGERVARGVAPLVARQAAHQGRDRAWGIASW